MIIVGLATLHNIHQTRVQVVPSTVNQMNVYQLKKRDRQLIRMLLIQLIFTIALTLPIAIQKLYTTLTQNAIKGTYRVAIENLVIQIMRILAYSNSCTSFFV